MRVLVCNDDGIESPGLSALADAALALSADVWVIAPERRWTAAGHQLTFDRELTLTRRKERWYACSGAPADCVVAAMTVLFDAQSRADLVLSGINDTRNVAEDIAYSGTLSIAREASFWGVPAIGISRQARAIEGVAEAACLRVLLQVLWESRSDWAAPGHWLNVNLPAALPAPMAQPVMGHDKIGNASVVVERSDARIVYKLRRGHPGTREAGDENSQLDAGRITVVRQRWAAAVPLPERLVSAWSAEVDR